MVTVELVHWQRRLGRRSCRHSLRLCSLHYYGRHGRMAAAAIPTLKAPMGAAQQVILGGAGVQFLGGQQQAVVGTLLAGTTVVIVQHLQPTP